MFFVHKGKVIVFNLDPINTSFSHKVSLIKYFGTLLFFLTFHSVGYVIEVVSQNIKKRIDVIKRIVDIDNANKHQYKKIDTIDADIREI